MQPNNFLEKKVRNMGGITSFIAWNKMCHFGESVHHNKDCIIPSLSLGKSYNKIHTHLSQGLSGIGKGVYNPAFWLLPLAY